MEILLLIGGLAGLAWSFVFFKWTGLWGVVLATIVMGTVFGAPFFSVGSVTLDRLLLSASLGVYFVCRYVGLTEPKGWMLADTIFAAFIAMLIVTTFISDWKYDGAAPVGRLLFYYLLPVIAYWLGRQVELTPQRLRILYATFAIFGVYISFTAVAEKFEMSWAVFPRYIASPKFAEFLGRGRGPLMNPSGNGVLLTFSMACCLVGLAYFKDKLQRVIVASATPIHLAGIYCTLTRCVWMSGAAVLVGITYIGLPKNWRVPFLIAVVFLGGLALVGKSESFKSFKRDKNVSVEDMRQSAALRPMLAMFAWQIFEDYPVFGCGTAQYLRHAKDYLSERNVDFPIAKAKGYVQHNIFLALLTENGLVTLIPFLLLLGLWSWWPIDFGEQLI